MFRFGSSLLQIMGKSGLSSGSASQHSSIISYKFLVQFSGRSSLEPAFKKFRSSWLLTVGYGKPPGKSRKFLKLFHLNQILKFFYHHVIVCLAHVGKTLSYFFQIEWLMEANTCHYYFMKYIFWIAVFMRRKKTFY